MRAATFILLLFAIPALITTIGQPAQGATCTIGSSPADYTIHTPLTSYYLILWSSDPGYINAGDVWIYEENWMWQNLQRHDSWRDDTCPDRPQVADWNIL